jgi:hypothetical protein
MAGAGQVLVPTLSGYYQMAGLGEVIDPAGAQRSADTVADGRRAATLNAASMLAAFRSK